MYYVVWVRNSKGFVVDANILVEPEDVMDWEDANEGTQGGSKAFETLEEAQKKFEEVTKDALDADGYWVHRRP